jgi:acetylglutamate kinase
MGSKGIVVIKYGGSAIGSSLAGVIEDILQIQKAGWNPVLVHGGGKDINRMLDRLQLKGHFVNGLRVTDQAAMEVVEMVLRGTVNTQIVAEIQRQGGRAVGLSGVDDCMIQARQKQEQLGYVGEAVAVRTELLHWALEKGWIPVIAPLGLGADGTRFNLNADEAAGAIAGALGAERCIFLTDVEGVIRHDPSTDSKQIIPKLTSTEITEMMESGEIYGGMIPKMQACLYALHKGAKGVQILDGRKSKHIVDVLIGGISAGTQVILEGIE